MRISDRHILTCCCTAGILLAVADARAFETRDTSGEQGTPGAMLQSLPSPRMPAAPNLGVDETMRRMLKDFRQSYSSGDKSSALKQLETAAEQGNVPARWKAARMLADGDGVPQDDYRAFRHFSRIVDAHVREGRDTLHAGAVADSLVAIGIYLRNGIKGSPIRANNSAAFEHFTQAAMHHAHAEAQYQLGMMLLDGSAGGAQPIRAARWLNLAAEKGHGEAQAVLGRMLFLGEAMPRQTVRGLMWLQLARENARSNATGWVRDLHEKAYAASSDGERRLAREHAERFSRAAERR
jgi:uncharacterized protein